MCKFSAVNWKYKSPSHLNLGDMIGVKTALNGRYILRQGHLVSDYQAFEGLVMQMLKLDPKLLLLPDKALGHRFFKTHDCPHTTAKTQVKKGIQFDYQIRVLTE